MAKTKPVKAKEENGKYPCVGGSPKERREMKRHMDMMKKFGKRRVMSEKEDSDEDD